MYYWDEKIVEYLHLQGMSKQKFKDFICYFK